MTTEYGKRLKEARKFAGLTQSMLAKKTGTALSTLASAEAEGSGSSETPKWADACGVSALWLSSGIGPMRTKTLFKSLENDGDQKGNADGTYEPISNVIVTSHSLNSIPLLSWESIGNWGEAMNQIAKNEFKAIETTYRGSLNAFALQVKGDSMQPTFEEGCYIDVEPFEHPLHGNYVVAVLKGGNAVLRQYVEDGNMKYLKPLNDRYPMVSLTDDDEIVGVVKATHRVF